MMDIDQQEIEWIRDRWFEMTHEKLKPGDPVFDEFHRRFSALSIILDGLHQSLSVEIRSIIMTTLPNYEFESAVEYLMRNTPDDELLMIYSRIEAANRRGVTYYVDYPAILGVARNRLQDGGFDWKFRYLENSTNSVYVAAATRFAKERGLITDG